MPTDTHEKESREECVSVARQLAEKIAGDTGHVVGDVSDRDDLFTFRVEAPITPAEVTAKRGVTSDGWGYEWKRIHLVLPGSNISGTDVFDVARKLGYRVVDVWSGYADAEPENRMDYHKEHANVRIALEKDD